MLQAVQAHMLPNHAGIAHVSCAHTELARPDTNALPRTSTVAAPLALPARQ
jgi:hypothetical protein